MSAVVPKPKQGKSLSAAADAGASPIVWVHVDQLVENPRNPNRHAQQTYEVLRASIEASGFTTPLVAWAECDEPAPPKAAGRPYYLLVAGHARLKVMLDLWAEHPAYLVAEAPGPGFLPVRLMRWASRDAADAYMIADNKTGRASAWDVGALGRLRADAVERQWSACNAAMARVPALNRPGPPQLVAPELPSLVRPPPPPEVQAAKKNPPPPDHWRFFDVSVPVTAVDHAEMMELMELYQQQEGTYSGAGDRIARAVTAHLKEMAHAAE